MKFLNVSVWIWGAGAVVIALLLIETAYFAGRHFGYEDGNTSCQLKQATAQKETDDKVHKDYNEIDLKTPYTGSRDARVNWLLDNARRSQ